MFKSLLNRFSKAQRKEVPLVSTLDVSRALSKNAKRRLPLNPDSKPRPEIDLDKWKQNDLDRLSKCWDKARLDPSSDSARSNLSAIIHDLHGASGAYGGGALTRLTGSLQRLIKASDDLQQNAALINLHVQACRAAGLGKAGDSVADAVCDALEAQVDASLDV